MDKILLMIKNNNNIEDLYQFEVKKSWITEKLNYFNLNLQSIEELEALINVDLCLIKNEAWILMQEIYNTAVKENEIIQL